MNPVDDLGDALPRPLARKLEDLAERDMVEGAELDVFLFELKTLPDYMGHVIARHAQSRGWKTPLRRLATRLRWLADRLRDLSDDDGCDLGAELLPPSPPSPIR